MTSNNNSIYFKDWDKAKQARSHELCRRGIFRQLLTPPQKMFYDLYKKGDFKEVALFCTRKIGKSYTGLLLACEFAISNPKTITRIVLPQLNQAKEIYEKIWQEIEDVLPSDVYPRYRRSVGKFDFTNGSSIVLGGACPDNINASRGPLTHFLLLDEISEYQKSNFRYAIYSVLKPQMATTAGKTVYFSTPPEDVDHPYLDTILPKLEAQGAALRFTIFHNPLVSEEARNSIIEEYGGIDNKDFRREFMCELIPDLSRVVVPEFDHKTHVVDTLPPLENEFGHKHVYVGYRAGDFGVGEQDLTGILGAVYDHNAQEIVINQERLLYKPVIDTFKEQWDSVEENLKDCVELVSTLDAFEQLKVTLRRQEGLDFKNPRKGKVTDQITYVRQLFESNKIKIHSSCTKLIEQLSKGIWKENGKEFSRSETLGHLDLLACLVYLVRSIEWKRRPLENRVNFTLGGQKNDKVKSGTIRNVKPNTNSSRVNRRL